MAESKQPIDDLEVEDINKMYRDGYVSATDKKKLLRKKAERTLGQMLGENLQGYGHAVITRTIEQATKGWEDLKAAATHDPSESTYKNFKAAGQAWWGQIQILTALFNAFGATNGAVAEKIALNAGASPGLAKVINVGVDVGSGFVPVGGAARSFAKGVQGIAEKGAAKTAAAAAKQEAKLAEKVVEDAINEGLKADGVVTSVKEPAAVSEEVIKRGKEFLAQGEQAAAPFVGPLSPQEEFYKSLQKYRREMEQITERKTHAMTKAEADKLGIHLEDLQNLVPGTALKEAEMAAYLKALDDPVNNMVALGKQTLEGVEGAGELFAKQVMEFFNYSPKFRQAEVTAGRSVEILKETPPMKAITDMLMGWAPESLAKGDFASAIQTMAEDIVAMSEKPGALKALQVQATSAIQNHGWKRWNEVAREVYYNVLLMRPYTATKNFIGNLYSAAELTAERATGNMFSLQQKRSFYDRANPMSNEAMFQLNGYLAGIGDGLGAYGKAFMKQSANQAGQMDFVPHKIGGWLGRVINAPGDNLRGMDGFFKAILHRGDLYAQASSMGLQKGLRGAALDEFVARRVNMPTTEMTEKATAFAQYGTFQNDLGVLGSRLQGLAQAGPLWTLFPFMKSPMNLTKFFWNRMPGTSLLSKSLYQDIIAGGERADMAIGRLTMANLSGMFFFGLAQQGLYTSGGPVDPTLKRSWEAWNKPYSFKSPFGKDKWIQIPQLDPATTPAYIIADFAEAFNQLDDATVEEIGMSFGLASVRDVVDKSYWQTFDDINGIISGMRTGEQPPKSALQVAAGPLTTLLSGGPIVGAAARFIDPVKREQRGFMDMWMAKIPGLSKTLEPSRDGYGDPILIPQAIGHAWLGMISPFTASDVETDDMKKEGARLQVKLPQFPYSIGAGKVRDDFDLRTAQPGDPVPVDITPEERGRWQKIYRNIIRGKETGWEALKNNEQYQKAEWPLQRQLFMNFLAGARSDAEKTLLAEDPVLLKKSVNATAAAILPLVPRMDRAGVEQQITESLDNFHGLTEEQQQNLNKYGILDSGEQRDAEVMKLEINKSIPELNAGAAAPPPPQK
jgi:hypothetical protein